MSSWRGAPSRTQQLIDYNTIVEKHQEDSYAPRRTIYTPKKSRAFLPLKQFQEYFGKVKPSFFQELKNIFSNANTEEMHSASLEEPFCQAQGSILTSRVRNIRRRRENRSESNNFRIQSMKTQDIYRKAKLNKLLKFNSALRDQTIHDSEVTQILRQSTTIVKQLKEAINQSRRTSTPSPMATRRSFLLGHSLERESLLAYLNPHNKDTFTTADLHKVIAWLHRVKVRVSPNISYFNVYIEEGNNAELLKMLVRKRTGWRVVEIPAIANLIWTQFYRRSVLKKRLTKREKTETDQDKPLLRQSAFKTGKYSLVPEPASPLSKAPQSSFAGQFRKLVPLSEAEDIMEVKVSVRQMKEVGVSHNVLIHNHFPLNKCISDKKNLLHNLTVHLSGQQRQVFDYLPESYEVTSLEHPIVEQLSAEGQKKEHWIIKPGEDSNRGRGIVVTHSPDQTLAELRKRLDWQESEQSGVKRRKVVRSVVLQRYIVPLLYNNRKFDVRFYMLVTLLNKQVRAYCYEECYIRTSSKSFDMESSSRFVHLTNDAIQSQSADYGKYEEGNKLSEALFQKFIQEEHRKRGGQDDIWNSLKHQMQQRCVDIIESSYQTLAMGCQPEEPRQQGADEFYFELFGLDFMIDHLLNLWLIEVNTNPAITHDCSKTLNLLIPKMLDNALTLAVEPIMKPLRLPETPFTNRFTAVLTRTLK